MSKVLIIGPSGSGKSYVSATLRKKGIKKAVDADLVEGLADYFDASGRWVEYPLDADKEFFDNHQFLWNRKFLEKFLQKQDEIYLFGLAGNIFDLIGLFEEAFFLKAKPEILAENLRHESRDNPMGKTYYQIRNALKYAEEIEENAKKLGIEMIDAHQSPEEIFLKISNNQP